MRQFRFANGFGASVVKDQYSYGGREGKYELAVLAWESEEDFHLTYLTSVTNDVLGWLNPDDVEKHLRDIMSLDPIQKY